MNQSYSYNQVSLKAYQIYLLIELTVETLKNMNEMRLFYVDLL